MHLRILMTAILAALVSFNTVAADEPVLLSMPEPPEGLSVSKVPLRMEDKIVGYHVQLADEQGVSKVIVQIETSYDRRERQDRVAATKEYVNGIANGLKGAGYTLQSNKVPQLKKAKFDKPLVVDMEFAKPDDSQLFVRQFIFFTEHGYNVQVLSSDQQELAQLARWAQHIRAVQQPKKLASGQERPKTR